MSTARNVLIVDDEPVVCLSCQHVLSSQGYGVETSTDPVEGLRLATDRDFAAVLVDIKMDKLNGLDFLQALRKEKPELPIVMITGYASEENLVRARELKASGLLEKPFTPESLKNTLKSLWSLEIPADHAAVVPSDRPEFSDAATCRPDPEARYFAEESWFQTREDGTVTVGALVAGPQSEIASSVRLPREGDFVYRGLPLATVEHGQNPRVYLTSPVTGRVVAVNGDLEDEPEMLWEWEKSGSWIARIEPSHLSRDLQMAAPREALIIGSDNPLTRNLREQLRSFGCEARLERSPRSIDASIAFLDGGSLGAEGVSMAADLAASESTMKVVVLGANASHEAEYRKAGVFFFTTTSPDRRELNDIVAAAFRKVVPPSGRVNEAELLPDLLRSVTIQNRSGEKVTLLTDGTSLLRRSGIGRSLTDLLLRNDFPVETMRTHHAEALTASALERESKAADRLVIVRFENRGEIPGTIRVRHMPETGSRIVTVTIQTEPKAKSDTTFEAKIEQALAQSLLELMA